MRQRDIDKLWRAWRATVEPMTTAIGEPEWVLLRVGFEAGARAASNVA